MTLEEILKLAPVVPVLTLAYEEQAVPLARALVAGGLPALEVTMRTPAALSSIRRIAAEVEGAIVGAGTVLNRTDYDRAVEAGARFAVSPGWVDGIPFYDHVPFMPAVMTPSEVIRGLAAGFKNFKFFPAVPAGGVAMLKAFAPVFQQAKFCPTGGITVDNAREFLALPNVITLGGSWVAPEAMVQAGQWDKITALAKAAAALR